MALDQSALLEVLDALRTADAGERITQAAETIYQALIDAELTAFIGASPHERTETRSNQRNGSRPRTLYEAPWVSRRLGLLDSDQGLVGPVCIVERGFELRGWDVAEVAVQAAGVVPVDPTEGGEFYVLDGLPRSASSRPVDQLGLVVTVDCLRESVVTSRGVV